MIKQAVILSAGFGTRMKDLTANVPKPMLPLFGKPMLEWQILFLKKLGIKQFFINLHYKGNVIKDYFKSGKMLDVQIIYHHEDVIMGTGGAYMAFREELDDYFVAMNSDIFIDFISYDFLRHETEFGVACMILKSYQEQNSYTPVYHQGNKLMAIGSSEKSDWGKGVFTGFQILSREIFDYLPDGPSSIISNFYQPALKEGKDLRVLLNVKKWIDVGTKQDYLLFKKMINNEHFLKNRGGLYGT
ncbi:MAG: hypothetical protein Kow00108_00910 [Calditrichia bacterium]